jgi:hypothetical protein
MEDSAFLVQLLAGLFYTAASVPLFRRAARSGEAPERILGATFLLFGISYIFYQLPNFSLFNPLWVPFGVVGRIATAAGLVAIAFFTGLVFRKGKAWATWLARACALFMVVGITVAFVEGDWEGYRPLSSVGFWLEWVGFITPTIWVAAEGFVHYRSASKRAAFGLCDPVVANRFLIWGLFGLSQLGTMIVVVPMDIEYELYGAFSAWGDAVGGGLEMFTIATVWLAFYPPAFYRNWVMGRAAAANAEGVG